PPGLVAGARVDLQSLWSARSASEVVRGVESGALGDDVLTLHAVGTRGDGLVVCSGGGSVLPVPAQEFSADERDAVVTGEQVLCGPEDRETGHRPARFTHGDGPVQPH